MHFLRSFYKTILYFYRYLERGRQGHYSRRRWDGGVAPKVVTAEKTIELTCDEDGALTGTVSYVVITGNGHDHTGASVQSGSEDVIGFVNTANGQIALVEYNTTLANSESGTFRGFLRNDNSLEIIQTQTYPNANPLVSIMRLPKV